MLVAVAADFVTARGNFRHLFGIAPRHLAGNKEGRFDAGLIKCIEQMPQSEVHTGSPKAENITGIHINIGIVNAAEKLRIKVYAEHCRTNLAVRPHQSFDQHTPFPSFAAIK